MNTMVSLIISLLLLTIPAGIILGIVLAIKASDEKDKSEKKKIIWWSAISFITPVVFIFVVLIVWGFVNIFTNTFAK